jgi:hypothetical protein
MEFLFAFQALNALTLYLPCASSGSDVNNLLSIAVRT